MSKARTGRRPLLVSVSMVVAGMIMASMASPPAWAVLLKAADWRMNETSGKMIDSSRHNNNGTPSRVVRTGSTYVFNGSTSHVGGRAGPSQPRPGRQEHHAQCLRQGKG